VCRVEIGGKYETREVKNNSK
ncbi:hypothetical protein ACN38_g8708, partial [Penicillium nordicum]